MTRALQRVRMARSTCAVASRVVVFAISLTVTVIVAALAIDSRIQLFVVHATNMTSTLTQPLAAEFDIRFIPFVITMLSSFCLAPQIFLEAEKAVWWRWADWSVTVPIMMALISALSGVRDAWLVAAQAFLALATILTGIFMDAAAPPVSWLAFVSGNVTMLFSWTVIFWHLAQSEAPDFVYAVVGSQFLMFSCYPLVAFLDGWYRWERETAEQVYAWLGAATKSLLAFVLVFGVRAYADAD
jgi:hypothetical protein